MIRFPRIPLLVVATLLTVTACTGKSSSNASDQASTAAQATAPAPAPTASTPDAVYGAPVFPGAIVRPASVVNMSGTAITVLSVDDTFKEVYAWYQEHIPNEVSHSTGAMQGAIFTMGTGKNQVKVVLAPSDQSDTYTIITYTRGGT